MSIKKRKTDHLKMASQSQYMNESTLGQLGLSYEPFLAAHPNSNFHLNQNIHGKKLKHPLWISSMTGGSNKSGKINKVLAKVAASYGLGMGLGSCRILLEKPEVIKDFQLRSLLKDQPFYANIGICQVHELLNQRKWKKFSGILKLLEVDGLIIHINPTQEYLQVDGSRLEVSPIEILNRLFESDNTYPIMVKEVGQGFGPKSLEAIIKLPLVGIEFGALGGTNFSLLELQRSKREKSTSSPLSSLTKLGHSVKEMVDFWTILDHNHSINKDWHVIISGGRGHDVLEDVALAKKIAKGHSFSLGIGYKALSLVNQGEKPFYQWIEEYLQAFYYLWKYTQQLDR